MDSFLDVLARCPLFHGSGAEEIESMLRCLTAKRRAFPAKAVIFEAGTETFELGVVLSGTVDIIQEDFWGNPGMLARLLPGQVFAESFVLAHTHRLPVSVIASQASQVILLDYRRILHTCTNACPHHARLISNLLTLIAQKNAYLTQKMEIITRKTIREKLLAFLSMESKRASSRSFTIPYDRQALADYLAVDRSALSRALGEMAREGLLSFRKNAFELNTTE
ncbi:Crp/Fnr family transcriptional regulator [Eubacteriales bacterium OttesenSCG-928-A19]|nr:Crp/Fnr family transcriptional regulator [Eubacteriales bacterium OttesenSCG-928-A19]